MPIEEYLVYDNAVYPASSSSAILKIASQLNSVESIATSQAIKRVQRSSFKELQSALINSVVALAVETAMMNFGALVFCSGRQSSQNMAALISEAMMGDNVSGEILERRKDVLCELRSLSCGLDEILEQTIIRGVAFHRQHFPQPPLNWIGIDGAP